jgi:hypothetical protein
MIGLTPFHGTVTDEKMAEIFSAFYETRRLIHFGIKLINNVIICSRSLLGSVILKIFGTPEISYFAVVYIK